MQCSELNPHIRYAAVQSGPFRKAEDSICYDCRLFFVKEGEGMIIADRVEYPLSRSSAVFLPPGTRYHFYFRKEYSVQKIIVLDFDLINDYNELRECLHTASVTTFEPQRVVTYERPEQFITPFVKITPELYDPLMKCCEEFLMQNPYYREAASALLKSCLIGMIRNFSAGTEYQKITPILEYVHSNYQNADLTNEDIADYFNYHPYYLSRLIKNCLGISLHQYLIQYRIKIAKKNLITTDDSINDISWKSGFHSTAHFIKTFKEETGSTPGKYRKKHLQDA